MVEYWIVISLLSLLLLSFSLSVLLFLRNAKKAKAIIVADKSSICFMMFVVLLVIGYLIWVIQMGYRMNYEQISISFCFIIFSSLILDTYFKENIFAYSHDVLLLSGKTYFMAQLQTTKIDFFRKARVEATYLDYHVLQHKIVLRFSENNYQKFQSECFIESTINNR